MMETGRIRFLKSISKTDADVINQVLHDVWGVQRVDVHLGRNEAVVAFDENAASFPDFERAVMDAGYPVEK